MQQKTADASQNYPDPSEAITDKKGFVISTVIFLLCGCLLVTHAQTGLTVSFIGVLIAVADADCSRKRGAPDL